MCQRFTAQEQIAGYSITFKDYGSLIKRLPVPAVGQECFEIVKPFWKTGNIGWYTPVQITIVEKLLSAAARHGDIV